MGIEKYPKKLEILTPVPSIIDPQRPVEEILAKSKRENSVVKEGTPLLRRRTPLLRRKVLLIRRELRRSGEDLRSLGEKLRCSGTKLRRSGTELRYPMASIVCYDLNAAMFPNSDARRHRPKIYSNRRSRHDDESYTDQKAKQGQTNRVLKRKREKFPYPATTPPSIPFGPYLSPQSITIGPRSMGSENLSNQFLRNRCRPNQNQLA
ncbi:hypothetical protein U1Q18_039904 [Sarracenia purpurea var. burkii]